MWRGTVGSECRWCSWTACTIKICLSSPSKGTRSSFLFKFYYQSLRNILHAFSPFLISCSCSVNCTDTFDGAVVCCLISLLFRVSLEHFEFAGRGLKVKFLFPSFTVRSFFFISPVNALLPPPPSVSREQLWFVASSLQISEAERYDLLSFLLV